MYKEFPPGWNHVRVPLSSRKGARAGLSLYTPGSTKGKAAHKLASWIVRVAGPRFLPGKAEAWTPEMAPGVFESLHETWQAEIGGFDEMAFYLPRQEAREGLAVLCIRDGQPCAFIKLRRVPAAPLLHESNAHQMAWAHHPQHFSLAEPLTSGEQAGWAYFAVGPLPPGLYKRPHAPPLEAIVAEIQAALAGLEDQRQAPEGWKPMHGDFTPWNLRRTSSGALYLIDWEFASWAPQGADLALYVATERSLRGASQDDIEIPTDAASFWHEIFSKKIEAKSRAGDDDLFLDVKMRDQLAMMLEGSAG